jgi:hypothetical protein
MIFIYILFLWTLKKDKVEVYKEIIKEKEQKCEELGLIDFKEAQSALDYLDRLIKAKIQFYTLFELMPIYNENNVPEKKVIEEIKHKIYATIVGSLSKEIKKKILKYSNQKGIEIYINERIMTYLNETDFKVSNSSSNIFKDIKMNSIDTLMS